VQQSAAERRFGRLDVMVANAGIGILCKAIEMSLADWRRQTAVNLDGVFLSVKYAVPAMRRAGGGSIIIMSSVAGLRGSAGLAGYCATKGGVRLFAKAVAMECAAAGDGIRINTVHPGVIDTPIWTKLPASAGSNAPIDPNEVAKAGVPLGRAGQAQDIAKRSAVPRLGRVQLHDGCGACDRRRDDSTPPQSPHRAKWKARSFVRYSPTLIRLSLAHALSSQIVSCRTVS
jgi:NAD(P)-dependent dehydrogenase (short-subunit alcohol dehydrogenase family)